MSDKSKIEWTDATWNPGGRRLTLLYLSRYAKAANLEPWQVLRMIGEVNYGSA